MMPSDKRGFHIEVVWFGIFIGIDNFLFSIVNPFRMAKKNGWKKALSFCVENGEYVFNIYTPIVNLDYYKR